MKKKLTNTLVKPTLVLGCMIAVIAIYGYFSNTALSQKEEFKSFDVKPEVIETSELPLMNVPTAAQIKKISARSLAPAVGVDLGDEVEPNGTPATATALMGNEGKVRGNVFPNADEDYFSFTANAGDRVYAGVMTSFSANASTDSQLRLFASDGTTVIEFDDDDGTQGSTSSTIANATIPANGTYYFRVNHFSATNQLRPYEMYFRVQSVAPVPEVEANDTPATANPLPASGLVSGARNPAVATEQDWYSMTLNAGDTVSLSLDLDPERDNVQWNGRLGIALFGDAANQILVVDDATAGSVTNPLSENLTMTVRTAGTYFAFVDSASAAVGGPTATYTLSVTRIPRLPVGVNCTTYTSTNVPQTIGPGTGLVSSTLTVPGNPRIASTRLLIDLNHLLMADLDVHLRSPAGNDNGVFTDIGAAAVGGQTTMNTIFDDYAGVPPQFTALNGPVHKPELAYRMDWYNGENAGGTWTLDIRDDTTNANGGTLNSWALEICEQPPPAGVIFYNENFDVGPFNLGNGGYTSSGLQNEWEWGVPTTAATPGVAAFLDCNGGSTGCWKTDLNDTYNASSDQLLVSPPINVPGTTGTINMSWAMRYQMENTSFDQARVIVREAANPANARVVWEWTGATMTNAVGNPTVTIGESAGWGEYRANITQFAGLTVEVVFQLSSDTTVQLGGLAIDDVVMRNIPNVAAGVNVGGRVLAADGRAIRGAVVSLSDLEGNTRTVRTNAFGYYNFDDVEAGATYTLTAASKRYTFNPQIINVTDSISDADITAIP